MASQLKLRFSKNQVLQITLAIIAGTLAGITYQCNNLISIGFYQMVDNRPTNRPTGKLPWSFAQRDNGAVSL
jgi:hypothetical protein